MAELKSSSLLTWLVSPFQPTRDHADDRFVYRGSSTLYLALIGLGVALLIVSLVGWAVDPKQFFFAYVVGWSFALTITLGALFLTLIHHITKSHWSVVVRRIPEAMTWMFPVLAVLSIPILLGMHDLYHWTHEELYDPADPHYDEILAGKRGYLNTPFWLARMAAYFLIWTFLSYRLLKLSLRQDVNPDRSIPKKQRRTAAWGIPVFGVTTAFASYDVLMSLDPHWFSTIFGVYIFAGAFFAGSATIVLLALLLQRLGGSLRGIFTIEHYHDLGKWMFAMTAFWAYIAFSQYMLYWYGGIPEETIFYRHRFEHGWQWHSYALMAFHFILPFLILLPRASKRILPVLGVMTGWFLVIHWFDIHWIAMPVYDVFYGAGHAGFSWISIACGLGFVFFYLGLTLYRLKQHSLVPYNDPRFVKSLQFESV
jgi:hypothetical protein